MNINRRKNGYKITVKKWSSNVTISNAKTGEIVKVATFSNHIEAVMAATAL